MSIDTSESFTWPTNFSCSLIAGNLIFPAHYNLTVSMMPAAGQPISGVGLNKIKKFVNFIQNSILIYDEHPALNSLSSFDSHTVQLPHEPNDFFFSNILFYKLTSITEDHFTISQITVDSSVGDRIKYQINESSIAYTQILDNDGWWNRDDVSTNNNQYFPSWNELDIESSPKFSPKVIKGGKNGVQQI